MNRIYHFDKFGNKHIMEYRESPEPGYYCQVPDCNYKELDKEWKDQSESYKEQILQDQLNREVLL